MSKEKQIEIAQEIVNNYIYKVEDVIVEKIPFTVKIKFSGDRQLRLTGKFAAEIIKVGDEK